MEPSCIFSTIEYFVLQGTQQSVFPDHFLAGGSSDKPSLIRIMMWSSGTTILKCSLLSQQHWHPLVTPENHWSGIRMCTGVPAIPMYVEVWGALYVQHIPKRTLCCWAEEHTGDHFEQRSGVALWPGVAVWRMGHSGGVRMTWPQRGWKIKICSCGRGRNGLYSFGKNHCRLFGCSNLEVQLAKSKN